MDAHSIIIHKSQEAETTQMSIISEWINKTGGITTPRQDVNKEKVEVAVAERYVRTLCTLHCFHVNIKLLKKKKKVHFNVWYSHTME